MLGPYADASMILICMSVLWGRNYLPQLKTEKFRCNSPSTISLNIDTDRYPVVSKDKNKFILKVIGSKIYIVGETGKEFNPARFREAQSSKIV